MKRAKEYFKNVAEWSEEVIVDLINKAREDAITECAQCAKIERISDSEPGTIFNQENIGQLCISGHWAGQYIRINKQSILSLINELK